MNCRSGVTIIEILVVVAIIGLIMATAPITLNLRTQVDKANDVKRKNDLSQLNTKLEEFYNNNNRYPRPEEICHNTTEELGSECDSFNLLCCNICGKVSTPSGMASYLNPLPCDPQYSSKDYLYQIANNTNPQWFKLYSKLSAPNLNYSPPSCQNGCGVNGAYSLGTSSSNVEID